jgi:hypothetical protein
MGINTKHGDKHETWGYNVNERHAKTSKHENETIIGQTVQ